LAKLANGGGWRLQAWIRASDLANTSAAVAAGRASTTPASDQFSTPSTGYGLNAAWQGRQGPWSWELGADARFAEGLAHERLRFMNGAFTRGRESGGRTAVGGIYAELVRDTGDLLLTGGARLDAWRQSGAVRRERDLGTNAITLNSSSADSSGTTPTARFGARWTLAGETWVRGAAYAGFRPPSLNELHRPFRVGNDVTEANPGLTPEKLYGAEVGVGGPGWSGTLFFNRLDDPIANVTVGVGPGTFPTAGFIPAGGTLRRRANAGRIDAWGLEGDVSHDFGALELDAAFSAAHARVDGGSSAPQLTGKRPAQTPKVTVTAGASWKASERLTLSAQARFESERFEDDLNSRVLAASVGLDARAAWRVGEDAEVYLAAENVTDARIEVGETGDGIESFAAPRLVRVGFAIRR
jgi:outer membrane receptor protein involved in Fe transport